MGFAAAIAERVFGVRPLAVEMYSIGQGELHPYWWPLGPVEWRVQDNTFSRVVGAVILWEWTDSARTQRRPARVWSVVVDDAATCRVELVRLYRGDVRRWARQECRRRNALRKGHTA